MGAVGGTVALRARTKVATSSSQKTVSNGRVKRSRRHNFDTTPSAYAHVVDDYTSDGRYDEGDGCSDDYGGDIDVGDVRRGDEAEEEEVQRVADMAGQEVPIAAVAGGWWRERYFNDVHGGECGSSIGGHW